MHSLPKPDNRLYLGKGGSGKTTLALCHSHDYARVIVCNPNGEDQHEEGAHVTDDRAELVQLAAQRGPWRIAWRFTKAGNVDGFDWVNRVAWAAGDCCIVWDEADLFMRHGNMPDAAYNLWNVGRHHRVRIFACSRRPARVSRDTTANLSRACVFRTQEPTDLAFLGEFMERSAADAVRQLQPFHAVDWTEEGWAVKKSLFP